jgi:HPt (histidine-containing phosphotransfer) domain-containing protein
MTVIPVLDPAVLESLRQLTPPGEPDVLKEVLQLFLDDVPARVERLRSAWQGGDAVAVQRAAHSLKGSAGNIGAADLLGVCRQLDELGRSGDLSKAAPLVTALDAEFSRVQFEIKRLIE